MKKIIYILLGFILLVSCTDQQDQILPEPNEEKVQVTMNIHNNSFELPVTRATANENTIDEIYVLVFEKTNTSATIDETARFKEVAKVINTGTVRILELTARAGTPCNIMVIANPEDKTVYYNGSPVNLSGTTAAAVLQAAIPANTSLKDVAARLLTKPLASTVSTTKQVPFAGKNLPLAGIASVSQIINSGVVNVDLYRSLAKLTVKLKPGGITDFELLGITIIKAPKDGQYWRLGNDQKNNSGNVINYYYTGTTNATMLVDAVSGTTSADPIYLYESRKEEETSIIIKGKYKGDIGYFKLGIQEDDGTHIDIKRNTNYEITITDVNYRGFDNIQDAINATTCTLIYTITSTDQGTHDIVSDGYMYLAFTSSKLEFVAPDGTYDIETAFEITMSSAVQYSTNSIKVESGAMQLLNAGGSVITEDRVVDTGVKRTIIRLRLNSGFQKGVLLVKYGSLTHRLEVERKNELWFKRNGAKKQLTGYYRAELTYTDALNSTILPDRVFMTLRGDETSGNTSILTYDSFYLHVGSTDNYGSTYYDRQIPVYLSPVNNFSGRIKCIIFQSKQL